ncbi:hypothetical protein ABCS02_28495 [Microbacterium sp. X-17]|uniref:hypothetical protein n=1 Tax=Microbacterium sp. X-17 TaxID=3144404 RepID=UPI0031F50419
MSSTNEAQRPDAGHRLPSRRAVVAASAWSVPAIAVATASPAYAASAEGPVNIPPTLTGVIGGGWSIATAFGANGLPTGYARSARPTATRIPITVSPARATVVTVTVSGAGFALYTVANNTAFLPTQSVTVTTSATGVAEVFVAIPPFSKGDTTATITAAANGDSAVSTLTAEPGLAYTLGGHTPEGQTGNGALLNAVGYPTPWALDVPLAAVYATQSSFMGITADGRVRTGGWNTSGECGVGAVSTAVAVPAEPIKEDGTVFTDAVRGIGAQNGSEQSLFILEDSSGDWWAAGQQLGNSLAMTGNIADRSLTRFTKIGQALPAKPTWVSYTRNSNVNLFTLADGTAWLAGTRVNMQYYDRGISTTGPSMVQLTWPDGTPVTGVKKAVQSNDRGMMLLFEDGRLAYSGTATTNITPADYPGDGRLHEIATPPGGIAELWERQPYEWETAGYFIKNTRDELYMLGGAYYGQSGHGMTTPVREWTKIPVENVDDFACGAHAMLVLDHSGDVWYSGVNDENNSGIDPAFAGPYATATKVTTLPPNAKAIAVTWWDAPFVAY